MPINAYSSYIVPGALISLQGIRFYRGAEKSLARPTSRCILFDG